MLITTKQIAVRLGLSQQTVSDVLRGGRKRKSYSEATRRRIESTAQEMGYRVNTAARAMLTGKFNAVGLLMSCHRHQSTINDSLLKGIHDTLDAQGVHLTVTFAKDEDLSTAASLPRVLNHAMVDGLLLNYTHDIPQRMLEVIERQRIPAIWVNSKQSSNCVLIDDKGGAALAVQQLVQEGHRLIAYCDLTAGLESAGEVHYSRIDRLAGYQKQMRLAGLEPIVISPRQPALAEMGVAFVVSALQKALRPSAIICYGNQELYAVGIALTQLNLRAGDDVSLSVFAHTDMAFGPTHRLVRLPYETVGASAARQLLQLQRDPAKPLDPVLIPMTSE